MRAAALGLVAGLVTVGACAPRARTQVMLVVGADPSIAASAVRLEVDVFGGPGLDELREDGGLGSSSQPVTFPVQVALVPEGQDPSRRFRAELAVLDVGGATLARYRVISGFVERRTLALPVFLESCCASVSCTDGETCRSCACTGATVDPTDLEPLASDAGAPDAPLPDAGPLDAWTPDAPMDAAGSSLDAAGCAPASSCFVVDGFGGQSYAVARNGAWAPPLSCGGALASSSDYGYGWFVLYNERPRAYDLRLETQRWGPETASYQLGLIAYALASPAERDLALTERPADCIGASRGGAADPADALLDVTIPAYGSLLVVVTSRVPGSIAAGGLQTAMSYR